MLLNCKQGSYSEETKEVIFERLKRIEESNMLYYSDLEKINQILINAIHRQITHVVGKMPYNASYKVIDNYTGEYKDEHLTLETRISYGMNGVHFRFQCDNIIKVQNDGEHRFDIECIKVTQDGLTKRVNDIFKVIEGKQDNE